MNKLDTITIQNFKSIRSLDLKIKPLNILIGANGAGKSNFVSAFKFLNHLIDENLQTYTAKLGGAHRILYYGGKVSDTMSFEVSFNGGANGYTCVLDTSSEDSFFFEKEAVWCHDQDRFPAPLTESLGSGHVETRINKAVKEKAVGVADHVLRRLRSWKLYHFHDTSDSARVKLTGDLEDNFILHPDARNLAAFLYCLEQTEEDYFKNIQDAVRLVAPFFDRFDLHPSRLNPDKIRLEWKEKGSDTYFDAASLSDGTLRFMCLATLLLQPRVPSVILLDEPELGLHPYAITVLADLLRSASQKAQVIVATQSVTLVNQFAPENIVVVDRENGQSVFRRLDQADMSQWLDEYGLGDLWEKNILGGRP